MKAHILVAAISLLALIGCTPGRSMSTSDGKGPQATPVGPYHPKNFEAPAGGFKEAVERASLLCADTNDCPSNVGLVIYRTDTWSYDKASDMSVLVKNQYFQCTGFLVADDVVATNSHCIPQEVKKDPEACADHLGFVVLRTDGSPQKTLCRSLLSASDIVDGDLTKPDYAFFKVDGKMEAQPWQLSREGFENQAKVFSYAIDPLLFCDGNRPCKAGEKPNTIAGDLKRKECRAVQGTMLAPEFTHPLAKSVALFGENNKCVIIGGNSGSPLFVKNGEVRGITYGGRKTLEDKQIVAGKEKNLGLGSNFACLSFLNESLLPTGCYTQAPPSTGLFSLDGRRMGDAINKEATKLAEQVPAVKFRMSLEKMPFHALDNTFHQALYVAGKKEMMRTLFVLNVECLKPREMWPSLGLKPTRSKGKEFLHLSIPSATVVLSATVDEYLRPSMTSHTEKLDSDDLTIEVGKIGSVHRASQRRYDSSRKSTASFQIRWCTPDDLNQKYILSK